MKKKFIRQYAGGTNRMQVNQQDMKIQPDMSEANAIQANNRANAGAAIGTVSTAVSAIPGVGAIAGPVVSIAGNLLKNAGVFDNKRKIREAKINAENLANYQTSQNAQDGTSAAYSGKSLTQFAEGTGAVTGPGDTKDAKSVKVDQMAEEARAYTKDWIQKRKVQNPEYQKQIDAVKQQKLDNISKTEVQPLPAILDSRGRETGAVGASFQDQKTGKMIVELDKYKVGSDKSFYHGTPTHEFKHQANKGTLLPYESKLISESIDTSTMPADLQEYYKDADEVSARIQGLRKKFGFKPDQVVTKDQLRNAWMKYNQEIGKEEERIKTEFNTQGKKFTAEDNIPNKARMNKGDSQVEDIRELVPKEDKLLNLLNNLSQVNSPTSSDTELLKAKYGMKGIKVGKGKC